jgi:hypothetical protein
MRIMTAAGLQERDVGATLNPGARLTVAFSDEVRSIRSSWAQRLGVGTRGPGRRLLAHKIEPDPRSGRRGPRVPWCAGMTFGSWPSARV